MLPLVNITFHLTSAATASKFYPNKKLFDDSLGVYPHKKVHIDLKPGAKPVHHNAYPFPHIHRQTFKKELEHMVELGILKPY